jgi:hypothetical protein
MIKNFVLMAKGLVASRLPNRFYPNPGIPFLVVKIPSRRTMTAFHFGLLYPLAIHASALAAFNLKSGRTITCAICAPF